MNVNQQQNQNKTADGQSRAGEAGANLTDVLAALQKLATEWMQEGNFLDNPHDHPSDRTCGKIYKGCAKELRALIGG